MKNSTLRARLSAPRLEEGAFEVIRVAGREALGKPYQIEVELIGAAGRSLDEEAMLGEPATLILELDGQVTRRIHGIVGRIDSALASESDQLAWTLTIAPRVSALGLTTATEVTMDLSVPDIVAERLERAGLKRGEDFYFNLLAAYPTREFVVQFKESNLSFVSRLCEHVGVTLHFRQTEEREVALFADGLSGFKTEHAGIRIPFRPRGERLDVFDLRTTRTTQPARVVVKDYNYRTPGVALQANAETQGKVGQRFEYGDHFKTPDEADGIARVRAEELAWQSHVYHGRSSRPELSAGTRFLLEGHPLGDRELLVVEIEHDLRQAAGLFVGPGTHGAYENRFKAIDASVPFRPLRATPKPHVAGVLTGIIEAAQPGQYAEIDADGRYHVRFLFDTGPAGRGKASRPIRMAQPHAGPGYGFHFPLRDGVEVVLSCVEGDPDRPIISGAVPNPATPTTVAASNGMRNVIRTGGGTEINIDDHEGSERLKISVPFGNTMLQLGAPNAPTAGVRAITDHEIHLISQAGQHLMDATELTGNAPEVLMHGLNNATLQGDTKARVTSASVAQMDAPVISQQAKGAWTANAGAFAALSAGVSATVSAPTVTNTGTLIQIHGDTVTITASGGVHVTAPSVTVDGAGEVKVTSGAAVSVYGAPIKLNV